MKKKPFHLTRKVSGISTKNISLNGKRSWFNVFYFYRRPPTSTRSSDSSIFQSNPRSNCLIQFEICDWEIFWVMRRRRRDFRELSSELSVGPFLAHFKPNRTFLGSNNLTSSSSHLFVTNIPEYHPGKPLHNHASTLCLC